MCFTVCSGKSQFHRHCTNVTTQPALGPGILVLGTWYHDEVSSKLKIDVLMSSHAFEPGIDDTCYRVDF